jgi:hypothetical protein
MERLGLSAAEAVRIPRHTLHASTRPHRSFMSVLFSTQKLELLLGATDAHLRQEAAATAEREPKDSDVRVSVAV